MACKELVRKLMDLKPHHSPNRTLKIYFIPVKEQGTF